MSGKVVKLRDAQGKEVEIAEDALEALPIIKELRAKVPTGEVVALADHQKVVADVVSLTDTVKQLTDASKKRDARDEVDALVEAGKLPPAQVDLYVELALKDHEHFVKLTGTLPVISPVKKPRETGSGDSTQAADDDVFVEIDRLVKVEMAADTKLSARDAQTRVLSANAALYARYAAATTVKV